MFDIGFWEMGLIFVLALLILGPERLPGVVRTVGLWIGRARMTFFSVRAEVERELRLQDVREAGRDFERELDRATRGSEPADAEQAATDKERDEHEPPR